jgi:lysophospholipase L1-like esterase
MLGDSLVEYFDWQARFPEIDVKNFGVGGETVAGLLERVPAICNTPRPDLILIMIGTNNLLMDDYSFINNYSLIINKLIASFPKSKTYITSLLPMTIPWLADDTIPRINLLIKDLCEHDQTDYFDLFTPFQQGLAAGNQLFLEDGVHLSDRGYALWSRTLEEKILPTD